MEEFVINENVNETVIIIEENREVVEFQEQGGSGGTNNYNDLIFKPQINGVELTGNKTLDELGIEQLKEGSNIEIKNNKISVLTTDNIEEDNTRPITSSAVYTEVGNINVLLKTI